MNMKTKQAIMLFGAMVVVSGLTAYGTVKYMSNSSMIENDGVLTDPNVHNVGFVPTFSSASVTDNDFTKAAEMTVNAVVGIRNTQQVQQMESMGMGDPFFDFFFGNRGNQQRQPKAREGYGSGVIISADGYIVTNNHVIDKADELKVTLNDGREFTATLVGTDPTTDIALIKVDAKGLPTVSFGKSDDLKVGEWVLAVGNPFMLNSTVTAGIVSAKARSLGMNGNQLGIESFIQTDAAVNPGNSGGALVNTAGELVGINTAIYSETGNYAGYSFAVPSSIVSKVVTDLKQYGTVQRALLGIMGGNVTAQLVEEEKLKVNEGVYVSEVTKEGAAEQSGIKAKDVIVAVNKVTVKTMAQLQEQIARFRPGDKVQITVNRDGKTQNFTATLTNSQGNTDVIQKKGLDFLGATFENMSQQELMKYGVRRGVKVKKLESNGAFAKSGMKENFVIVKINDSVVSSEKEIEAAYNALTSNRGADQEPVMFIVGVYPNGKTAYYAVDLSK